MGLFLQLRALNSIFRSKGVAGVSSYDVPVPMRTSDSLLLSDEILHAFYT